MTTTERLRELLAKYDRLEGITITSQAAFDELDSAAVELRESAVNALPALLKVVDAAKAMTLVDSYDVTDVNRAQDRIDEALREFDGLNNNDKETK